MSSLHRKAALFSAPILVGIAVAGSAPMASALTINPTWDSTITNDTANAANIEAGINAAIARVDSYVASPVTVNILFKETSSGLGASSTSYSTETYATYVNQLQTKQTLSADDTTAIANLPASTSAVNGNTNASIVVALPLLRALGVNINSTYDGTIYLNTSIMNLSRTGTQNSSYYDLQAVAGHEIDEVLSIGGMGSQLGSGSTSSLGVLDLYRFGGNGARSYTTSTSASAYFSINNGATDFVSFNQAGGGSDYSDWGGGHSPQLQDAFGTPNTQVNIGGNELAALDVAGWNLTASGLAAESLVPEPAVAGILSVGLFGLLARRRRA